MKSTAPLCNILKGVCKICFNREYNSLAMLFPIGMEVSRIFPQKGAGKPGCFPAGKSLAKRITIPAEIKFSGWA